MKENEINRVSRRMKELEGAYLAGVGRASSLAWFLFAKNKTEYALHLQTGFRVVTDENIIFASADIFQPSGFLENSEEFDYNTFDWDIQGNSRYDERVDSFIDKYLNKLVVIGVFVSQYGDLTIKMNNGIEIEVFINMSKDECWRFFRRHSENHLIIGGDGIIDRISGRKVYAGSNADFSDIYRSLVL